MLFSLSFESLREEYLYVAATSLENDTGDLTLLTNALKANLGRFDGDLSFKRGVQSLYEFCVNLGTIYVTLGPGNSILNPLQAVQRRIARAFHLNTVVLDQGLHEAARHDRLCCEIGTGIRQRRLELFDPPALVRLENISYPSKNGKKRRQAQNKPHLH